MLLEGNLSAEHASIAQGLSRLAATCYDALHVNVCILVPRQWVALGLNGLRTKRRPGAQLAGSAAT